MIRVHPFRPLLLPLILLMCAGGLRAQFYQGTQQEYGKNRVQYQDFLWQNYRFDRLETYFYKGGRDLAQFVAQSGHKHLKELEREFDFTVDERLQFIVYTSLTDFRQSNIGLSADEQFNIGGVNRIVGTKIFVYYEGDHVLLDRQVRAGIAQVLLDQMMYGGNWKEVLKNSTLLNIPEWFNKGLVAHTAGPWDAATEAHIRDGVMSGRYNKFNRLEGDEAVYAGQAIWSYVAEVYGPSVIPNILYMTRVSRNAENGFLFVLGVSLKTLTQECLAYYRTRYEQEDRSRTDVSLEPLPIRTRKTRTYSQFKQSPDGRYMAWVSNEMGQYKVWLYEPATKKLKVIIKGEKKLNRIVDKSYPVLAWHPGSKALSYTTEKRGELFLNMYTVDDRKTTTRPVFMLDKVLSMAYSDDGRNMVFSGVREGRTDLYLYYVIGNRQEQLTDDQYDDLDPSFVRNSTAIIFSSDRTDDTLRANAPVALVNGAKDLYLYDLANRSPLLKRLTATPGVNEVLPAALDSLDFTYLSDANGLWNRYKVSFDSVVSHIDTTIHFRYVISTERMTDLRNGLLEHSFNAERQRFTQLEYREGKYRFYAGRTTDQRSVLLEPGEAGGVPKEPAKVGVNEQMSPVVKVDPQVPRIRDANDVDITNYVFSDETPGKPNGTEGTGGTAVAGNSTGRTQGSGVGGASAQKGDTLAAKPFAYPEQRNYNVNFATDQVLTQLGNAYSDQFYQPLTGPEGINPGLSGLISMGISDLFEDYKVVGGFRLALDLNNNDYRISFSNLKRRLDKTISFQRQAYRGLSNVGVVKVHTHQLKYQVSWPFSELASVRGSVLYRNDRYVLQSTDLFTLEADNFYDHMVGAKVEYVYDSSIPRGLNLYTGWKLKFFGEYYQQPDEQRGDMQVLGADLRHSLRVWRDMILVNRLAGSTSLGSRKILYYLGGVDNWMSPKIDESTGVDLTNNYFYQGLGVPMRGFYYNSRNGNNFAVFNTELRAPIVRMLVNRPIRSDFVNNFQIALFGDLGSAWTGSGPYSDDNAFNTQTIYRNPLTITIRSQREPIVGGYGFGLRTRLLGYFVRADWAWGVDDGVVLPSVFYFSLSLDI